MRCVSVIVLLIAVMALAGCATSSDATDSQATATRPPIGGDGMPLLAVEPATINTVSNPQAACDANEEPGDCYLPLYRDLSHGQASRVVLTDELAAECPLDAKEAVDDQSHCWPQPTTVDGQPTKLNVVCRAIKPGDSQVWYGVSVLRTQFSNPDDSRLALPLPGDNGNQVVVFNWKQFFTLDNPAAANTLPLCPI